MTSKINRKRENKKGRRPQKNKKMEDDIQKKKGRQTQKKGRRPQKKMEDDLNHNLKNQR